MASTTDTLRSQRYTSPTSVAPIVVGCDDSDGGRDALELARVLAAVRGARCVVARDLDSPGQELLERVRREHAGTLVVGSPHRGTLGRAALGSVAEHVLHRSPCEVVVAPRGYRSAGHAGLSKIAVAIDGTEGSKIALTRAEDLAREAGATIEILVVEDPVVAGVQAEFALASPDAPRSAADVLKGALGSVDPALKPEGKRIDPGWRQIARTIAAALSEACSEDVDLLITGSRSRSERFWLGSVTRYLIARAPCPVLVVPEQREV